jgi:hypothetical protein
MCTSPSSMQTKRGMPENPRDMPRFDERPQGYTLRWLRDQWNCSSSVEPVRAFTEDEPPWITVVTSSK